MMNADKTTDNGYIYVLKLMTQMKGYGATFFSGVIASFFRKIMPIFLSFLTSWLLNSVIVGNSINVLYWTLFIIVLLILNSIFQYVDVLVSHDMAYKILANMRNMLYRKIDIIAPSATEDKQSGNILSIVLEDVELLEWFFAHTICQLVIAIIMPVCGLIVLCKFDLFLGGINLLFIALLLLVPLISGKKSLKQGSEARNKFGELNAVVVDGIQGIKDVISFEWVDFYYKKVFDYVDNYNKATMKYQKRASTEGAFIKLIIGLATLCSTVIILRLTFYNIISPQWVLPLFVLSSLVFSPIVGVLNMSTNFGSIFAAAHRVFDLMQTEPLVVDEGTIDAESLCLGNKSVLSIDKLYFKYPTRNNNLNNPNVIQGLSFSVDMYENVVIVGESGSGKSTLVNLILRFWDPFEGAIRIAGTNINNLTIESLRNIITVVRQDIYLFNVSIIDNLRMAKMTATDIEIINACKLAQAHDFIKDLPNGYDTVVGERGVRISGGEKQRIALAQAFLRNTPILILDEASSNLDSENERLINMAVDKLKNGRVMITIAHRISTIKKADRIIVIDKGRKETEGTYDYLINNSTLFKKILGGLNI